MSLINQVLQDLETRRGAPVVQTAGPVLEDLRPVMGNVPSPSRAKQWVVLGVILVAVSAIFAWHRWPVIAGFAYSPVVSTVDDQGWTTDPTPPMVSSPLLVPPPLVGTEQSEVSTASMAGTAAPPLPESQPQAIVNAAPESETGEAQTLTDRTRAALMSGQKSAEAVQVKPAPMITKSEPVAAPLVAKAKPESVPIRAEAAKLSNEAKPERPPLADIQTRPRKPIAAPKRPVSAVTASKTKTDGVMRKTARPLTAQEQAENAYRKGAKNLQRRLVTVAEKDLNMALLYDPKHVKARELLVGMLLRDGRRDEAQLLLKAGLDEVPAQSSFTLLLARLYFDQGAENEALGLLETVRDNARANADYQTFLATLYQRAGRHGEAVTAYRQAIGLRPTEGKWWLGLAISLEAQEESVQARGAYQRAVRSGDLDSKLLSYAQSRMNSIGKK